MLRKIFLTVVLLIVAFVALYLSQIIFWPRTEGWWFLASFITTMANLIFWIGVSACAVLDIMATWENKTFCQKLDEVTGVPTQSTE